MYIRIMVAYYFSPLQRDTLSYTNFLPIKSQTTPFFENLCFKNIKRQKSCGKIMPHSITPFVTKQNLKSLQCLYKELCFSDALNPPTSSPYTIVILFEVCFPVCPFQMLAFLKRIFQRHCTQALMEKNLLIDTAAHASFTLFEKESKK